MGKSLSLKVTCVLVCLEFSQTVIAPARINTYFPPSLSRSLGLSFSWPTPPQSTTSSYFHQPIRRIAERAQIGTNSLSSFPFSDSPIPNILHHRSLQTEKANIGGFLSPLMFTDGNHKTGWAIAYRLTSLKTKCRCLCTLKPKSSQLTPATTQVFRTLAFPSYSPPLPTISVPCAVHSPSSSHFLISILLLISLRASLTPGNRLIFF
ncbi:unnamed protein product [Prunus armeniaca]